MDKNGQENPDLRETASNFFLHFVVKKNWMRGVKNTCDGAWKPILFFFWPYVFVSFQCIWGFFIGDHGILTQLHVSFHQKETVDDVVLSLIYLQQIQISEI